jgi:hypothetical protein
VSQQEPVVQQTGQVGRLFEQPPDAVIAYSDFAQVLGTGSEVVLQFYETIPDVPTGPAGGISMVRSKLRATIIVSPQHAVNIGRLLLQQAGQEGAATPGEQAPEQAPPTASASTTMNAVSAGTFR